MTDTYILEISPDIHDFPLECISAAQLLEETQSFAAAVTKITEQDAAWEVFLNMFRQNSFQLKPMDTDGYILKSSPMSKSNYFYKRYACFKEKTQQMTLQDMTSQTAMYQLRMLLEDTEGPFVYLYGTGLITMDRFIREMANSVPYYLGTIFTLSE